jgi:dienelactone hydrolase
VFPGEPAIIWVHGGGFKGNVNGAYPLFTSIAQPYATRGYVGISVEYRTDTTSDCQWVQDHDPSTPGYAEELAQCERGIAAAQHDTQAAVRWVRRNAAAYDVDPNRIAVGGFSAGAVTAANVAYRTYAASDRRYSRADDPGADSRVQGAFGASGCNFSPETIGPGDAPVSLIHSELDRAVDYRDCVVPTVTRARARAAGLVAELTSYCDQARHAAGLYYRYQAETDEQWTTFLVRELRIYRGTRPPSADPVCP